MQVKDILTRQLPEFVRNDYPAFIEFMKAYYEWLDITSPGKLETLVDIDTTIDDFIQYFKTQLDVNGEDYSFISPRLFLKNSKQLFSAKSSEQSIKFLFRILFGKDSEVITPWQYVLIPSEGKWYEDISMFITTTQGNAMDLSGDYILVYGADGEYHKTFVKAVVPYSTNIYQVFVERFPYQSIRPGTTFKSSNLTILGQVATTTSKAQVDVGGSGFVVGQLFNIEGYSGSGTIVKIKSTDVNGAITGVEIIEFGTGYNTDFTAKIYPENAILGAKLSTINLQRTWAGASGATGATNSLNATYDTQDVLKNPTEALTFVRHDYTSVNGATGATGPGPYFVDLTYVGDTLGEVKSQANEERATIVNAGVLRMKIGAMAIYPGYYLDGSSLVSDQSYIQDSYYYQKFSYVTAIEELLNTYKTVLKTTLHPVGTELFGTYTVTNQFNVGLVVDPQINLISTAAPLEDTATVTENVALGPHKYISDTVTTDNEGYVVGGPYVEVLPDPFWDITYLENEQPISN